MSSPFLLHIETATNVCSVALSKGEEIIALRESDEDRSHGSLLTVFINEVLKESELNPEDLDAISVSKGPGSYTGLRIGVSVTKGFAYAREIPVIGIVTLQAMAIAAMHNEAVKKLQLAYPDLLYCPMIDARRMEVYSAVYDKGLQEVEKVSAVIVEENSYSKLLAENKLVYFGNGSDKIIDTIKHQNAHFIKGIVPSASFMLPLALKAFKQKTFEDTAYFEPFYLKDFVATVPKNKML